MERVKELVQFMEGVRTCMTKKLKWVFRTRNRESFLTTEVLRYLSVACLAFSMCEIDGVMDFFIAGYAMAGFVFADACYHGGHFRRYAIRISLFAVLTEPFFDYMSTGRFFNMQIQSPLLLAVAALLPFRYLCRLQEKKDGALYPYRGVFYYVTFSLLVLGAVYLHVPYPEVIVSSMALPVFFRGYRNLALALLCLLSVMVGCHVAPWLVLVLYFYYDRKRVETRKSPWIPYVFYMAALSMACLFR